MKVSPILPSPYTSKGSIFHAPCSHCNRMHTGNNLGVEEGAPPFTYICVFCMGPENKFHIDLAHDDAFNALSPHAQQAVRVSLYGTIEARLIEMRIKARK